MGDWGGGETGERRWGSVEGGEGESGDISRRGGAEVGSSVREEGVGDWGRGQGEGSWRRCERGGGGGSGGWRWKEEEEGEKLGKEEAEDWGRSVVGEGKEAGGGGV